MLFLAIVATYLGLLVIAAILYWVLAPERGVKTFFQGVALSFIPMMILMIWSVW